MEQEIKIRKRYEDHGFGFKVVFLNVPLIKRMGSWCVEVNWEKVAALLLTAVASKPGRITGSELRFIRKRQGMTLAQFATRFGVTHPAVMKWERAGDAPTGMGWATEKDIRLAVLGWSHCSPEEFMAAYAQFEAPPGGRHRAYTYDVPTDSLAA
jgi:DNA-binding transcriptional regulator YiaG